MQSAQSLASHGKLSSLSVSPLRAAPGLGGRLEADVGDSGHCKDATKGPLASPAVADARGLARRGSAQAPWEEPPGPRSLGSLLLLPARGRWSAGSGRGACRAAGARLAATAACRLLGSADAGPAEAGRSSRRSRGLRGAMEPAKVSARQHPGAVGSAAALSRPAGRPAQLGSPAPSGVSLRVDLHPGSPILPHLLPRM